MPKCNNCGYEAKVDDFDAAMSVYHDLKCPKCGTTNLDTSDIAETWGYGDDNSLQTNKEKDANEILPKKTEKTTSEHLDEEVRQAIIKLCDALCSWERATSRESVLIIREQYGFCYRAVSGKPGVPDDITDSQLIENIMGDNST